MAKITNFLLFISNHPLRPAIDSITSLLLLIVSICLLSFCWLPYIKNSTAYPQPNFKAMLMDSREFQAYQERLKVYHDAEEEQRQKFLGSLFIGK